MKTLAGFVVAATVALLPALASAQCASQATTASTATSAPVQTAEAPSSTSTK
jgi:hypothetical protein